MNDVHADAADLPERPGYLLVLAAGPAIWFGHFLSTYVAASIWCAKFAPDGRLRPLAAIVGVATLGALAAIAAVGFSGFRRHRHGGEALPHDFDSPADRHRFLGFATLLLAGLSGIATIGVAAHFFYFGTCR
jgi:hypothetical protein